VISNWLGCGVISFVGIVAIMSFMHMGRHSLPVFDGDEVPQPRKRTRVGPPEIHSEQNVTLDNPVRFNCDLKTLRAFIIEHSLTDLAILSTSYNEGVVRKFYESFPEGTSSTSTEVDIKIGGKRIKLSP
jgi:hypothetical protein